MRQGKCSVILCIILLLLFFFPDSSPGNGPIIPFTVDNIVDTEIYALDLLVNSTYGDFEPEQEKWLNVTGLRESDGFAWNVLGSVKERVRDQVYAALGREGGERALNGPIPGTEPLPVYGNISGYVQGTWVRSTLERELSKPHLNVTAILPRVYRPWDHFRRNITGDSGDVYITFKDKGNPDDVNGTHVRGLTADMTIADETSPGAGWSFVLYGEHVLDTGSIVLTTSSDKFAGLFALPHLAPSQNHFSAYKQRLNHTIKDVIKLQKEYKYGTANPWSSSIDGDNEYAAPNCEFVVYLQQHLLETILRNGAISTISQAMAAELEAEIESPSGHPGIVAPDLVMSMLIYSPDCGFILESRGPPKFTPNEGKHLIGKKDEVRLSLGRKHISVLALLIFAQTYLLIRQMKDACTPSTQSRISVYTISFFALADGSVATALLPLGLLYESISPLLFAASFLAWLSVLPFSLKFIQDLASVQREDMRRLRRLQGLTTPDAEPRTMPIPVISAAGADSLPVPVPATPSVSLPPSAVIMPSDQDLDDATAVGEPVASRDEQPVPAVYFPTLFCLFFISIYADSWSPAWSKAYKNTLCFVYLSFWVPQIYRNTMRNCRKALLWEFVIGQSTLRLGLILYFYAYEHKIVLLKVDWRTALVFVAWVWLQICILACQEIFGPRTFVPASWVPPAYDYHPILHEDEESTRVILGSSSLPSSSRDSKSERPRTTAAESKDSKFKRLFDCAICMQHVEVPVIPGTSAGDSGVTAASAGGGSAFIWRRNYMITPCRHVFHTKCLEAAMRYRLQCPICREGLPPV